ncbi:MAG: sensor histidine kinase KdpD [Phycisphaerales bacterium]
MSDRRPDPAELLAQLTPDAGAAGRGRLKIFFGMSPGVGKTYAMLASAQRLAAQGVDVAVGIVETHRRTETEQLLLGLDILPRRRIEHRGADAAGPAVALDEFDADAAIARRPDILLVDELAHTNAPGSAREKRWEDVRACLRAGINVHTTLNVQHLESINDLVARITGVSVRETVPDAVFEEADEVELVDTPPDVLLERLKAGKVYLGDAAARAADPLSGFFRRSNLAALRELALRQTAAWVDSDQRRTRLEQGARTPWTASERVLVAVSPSPVCPRVVRAAKRMAAGLHAELLAVHVETLGAPLSDDDRLRLQQTMRLAESLGATTTTIAGEHPARELVAFARSRGVARIVVGKTLRPRWRELLQGSFIHELIRESGEIDISVASGEDDAAARAPASVDRAGERTTPLERLARHGAAALIVAACAGIAWVFYKPPDLSEEALILLGGVVLAALWCGRRPAVTATLLAVLAFNFLFTPPRFSLSVEDPSSLLTFAVMLAVGLIVGTLAARTRAQSREALERERTTAALYALARELAGAQEAAAVAAIAARHAHDLFGGGDAVVAVPRRGPGARAALDPLGVAGSPDWFDERERGVAQWAFDNRRPAGRGTSSLPAATGRFVPLIGTSGCVGLLALRPRDTAPAADPLGSGGPLLLDAFASQVASALERVALGESQHAARLEAERERLRSALLSSVSHDLRTPLAGIAGAASTLEQAELPGAASVDPATRRTLLRSIVEESVRLGDIIANLVFATRLEAGGVSLRREWTTLEEIVGTGLARHREALAGRAVRIHLPAELPMIRVDAAILPQVVHNLVQNALRHTPAGTPITIDAWTADGQLIVRVRDEGPGLAHDEAALVFQRFYRGRARDAGAGTGAGLGLGLTICEGIVRAHGGRIWAEPAQPRGVAFCFALPLEPAPPAPPQERADAADGAPSNPATAATGTTP